MIRRLSVHLDFGCGAEPRRVGTLGRDEARRSAAFEWDAGFAASPLPVSPVARIAYDGLLRPNAGRGARLPALFEDSLPDGWGRLLLDREIAARGISRAEIGDLERLATIGRHGAGALTYMPETGGQPIGVIDLGWFEEIIPHVEDGASAADLSRLRIISGGSQGARPKFMAQIHEDMRTLRDHRASVSEGWRQVLIKGRGSSDPVGAVQAEIGYGALMRRAGIDVSGMFALEGVRECFFATERFDRPGAGRLHMASVAGLLDSGMAHGVIDYADLVRLTKLLCGRADAVEQVFRRMVFNVRALNRDDHVRNHAFLMNAEGEWSLAPAYDVSFSEGPGGEHSISVGGEGRMPGKEAMARVAHIAGIRPARRDAIIEEVEASLAGWRAIATDHDVPQRMIRQIEHEIANARRWA